MKQVAKLLIIDDTDSYLMMFRGEHPRFPNNPDLPGGTIEEGESSLDALVREVAEEAGVAIDPDIVQQLYEGNEYSKHETHYSLYLARLAVRPTVTINWEHSAYAWLDRDMFLEKAGNATDTYMRMVHDVIAAHK